MELTYPNPRAIGQRPPVLAIAAPLGLTAVLVSLGALWPHLDLRAVRLVSPDALLALVKLMTAASIGYLLTSVQRQAADRSASRSLEQAQILLCVAGALVVMLIGDSLARAVGILGGASLIRFRTPIEDPKDATVLFLLMGVGMATGLGHFGVAGLAVLFLTLLLPGLHGTPEQKLRSLTLQVVCAGPGLPMERVESVLRRRAAAFETREISKEERPMIRYQVSVDAALPLARLSQELLDDSQAATQSLSWDTPKKERYL
jgi:hypothetical protein